MDASKLEAALTPRTRMVVAVSILGNPAPLDRIRAFCDAHDLILFEDNCESLGASLNGRLCGTFGDINTFSTFYSHHISTMEGGLLVTNETEIDHLARAIRNHGWARDVPADSVVNQGQQLDDPFFEAYRFVVPGYNVRPLELAGAVGIEQLKKLDDMLAVRRRNAAHFVQLFKDDPRFIIQRENGSSSWFSFTMILNPDAGLDRDSRDGCPAECRRRVSNDHRRLFPASCGCQVFRLRDRRQHGQCQTGARARVLRRQPPARPHSRAESPALRTEWGLTLFLRIS